MEPFKLQVEIGNAKFSGEGARDFVEDTYKRFLEALSAQGTATTNKPLTDGRPVDERPIGISEEILLKAFLREDQLISLKHLPPTDNSTRAADAAILLLYGFKKLLSMEDVPVTKLNEGLRKSGLNLNRVDTALSIHGSLYRKGGQRSGGRYSLTNPGEAQAEKWLKEWYS